MNRKWENQHFQSLVSDLASDAKTGRMKKFIQHSDKTTYDHCMDVARHSYFFARRLHLQVDEKALVRGAFLHDYYLYDWHETDDGHGLHGFSHSTTARDNAVEHFGISKHTQNVIESHMHSSKLRFTSPSGCGKDIVYC